jgi:DNA repair protein RadD
MTPPELRPYQIENVAALAAIAPGARVLNVGPTGSGKTVIFCELIRRQVARFRRVLVIAHRREIIAQTSRKLYENGVRHGIIQAGFDPRPMEPVQVASIATLYVRAVRSEAMRLPPADLVIVDEAHHSIAHTYSKIIERYPEATVIGFTATPCRGDGRGLGGIFKSMIEMPQVAALIEQKHLVPTLCYAPVDPDLRGVKTQAGDYAVGQLERRMNTDKLVGDIVTHWHKYGQGRPTVVFAVGVAHSIHLRDEFLKSGVTAEHIDGSTPKDERDAILKRLASGATTIVTNCMVLTEGWDCPEVGCCILARPTKSMGLFRQMIGRGLRPAAGKINNILLDHSGAVYRHGLPEDHVAWSLSANHKATAPAHEARKQHDKKGLLDCPACHTLSIRLGGQLCPNCGWQPKRAGEFVATADGELGLVRDGKAKANTYNPATRDEWHGMLTAIALERGYARGWVSHKYKEKFGTWPAWGSSPMPLKPSHEVRAWVRSRIIAFAKQQQGAA